MYVYQCRHVKKESKIGQDLHSCMLLIVYIFMVGSSTFLTTGYAVHALDVVDLIIPVAEAHKKLARLTRHCARLPWEDG